MSNYEDILIPDDLAPHLTAKRLARWAFPPLRQDDQGRWLLTSPSGADYGGELIGNLLASELPHVARAVYGAVPQDTGKRACPGDGPDTIRQMLGEFFS